MMVYIQDMWLASQRRAFLLAVYFRPGSLPEIKDFRLSWEFFMVILCLLIKVTFIDGTK
jgi:hypothetical protein